MRKKLLAYERLGLPPVTDEQIRKRQAVAKILRYPAALASWSVSKHCSSYPPCLPLVYYQGLRF
jgi:hypothetical protein